ncbi:hypothetical protein [Pararhodospirillum photometricum]|uniref:hypothetical protein n=1 Tax=Pararhodospirillum photometricum TaxID=1084 RepID=UPI0026C2BB72
MSGVQAKWQAWGEAKTKTVLAGAEKQPKTLKKTYPSEAEAKAAAEAHWAALQRSQMSLRLSLARGRADVVAGQTFRVAGFRPELDAVEWWVHEVTHAVDGSGGYTTSLSAESAAPEEP